MKEAENDDKKKEKKNMKFDIKSKKSLPYYNSADFFWNVKNSSNLRKQNKLFFILKKLKNYSLGLMAYTCPVNNLRVFFHRQRGVHIGKNVFLGLRCTLDHAYPDYIYIDDNSILSGDVYIVAHNKPSVFFKRKIPSYVAPVLISKNCFIGVRSVILPGVTIGKGSFIAGGAVISKSIPENSVAQGNPAVVIHKLNGNA